MRTMAIAFWLLTALLAPLGAQTNVDEEIARADFARSEEMDLRGARDLYERLRERPDLAPAQMSKIWLGLGRCLAQLGETERARQAFQNAAKGEGEAAKQAQEILDGRSIDVDPRFVARVRKALDDMRTGEGSTGADARKTLVLLGPPAIPLIVAETKVRSDDSGFVRDVVGVMADIGGEAGAEFFRAAARSDDAFYRRSVITGVEERSRNYNAKALRGPILRDAIFAFLDDEDPYVREQALDYAFGADETMPPIAIVLRLHARSDATQRAALLDRLSGRREVARGAAMAGQGPSWIREMLVRGGDDAATFARTLESNLAGDDADVREASFGVVSAATGAQVQLGRFGPLLLRALAAEVRRGNRVAPYGLGQRGLPLDTTGCYTENPDGILAALTELAESLGKSKLTRESHQGARWTSGSPLQDLTRNLANRLIQVPLGIDRIETVCGLASRGYCDPEVYGKWVDRQVREVADVDRTLDAAAGLPAEQVVYQAFMNLEPSEAALGRLGSRLVEEVATAPAQFRDSVVYPMARLLLVRESEIATRYFLAAVDRRADFYPVVSALVSLDEKTNTAALRALLLNGGDSPTDAEARNRLLHALLFAGDLEAARMTGRAYAKGLAADEDRGGGRYLPVRGIAALSLWYSPNRGRGTGRPGGRDDAIGVPEDVIAVALDAALREGGSSAWEDALGVLSSRHLAGMSTYFTSRGPSEEVRSIIVRHRALAPEDLRERLGYALVGRNEDSPVVEPVAEDLLALTAPEARALRRNAAFYFMRRGLWNHHDRILEVMKAEDGKDNSYGRAARYWPRERLDEISFLLASEEADSRQHAAEELVERLGAGALERVLPLFGDPDPGVRQAMVRNAIRMPDRRLIPPLVERLLDENEKLREEARKTLEQLQLYFDQKDRWENWGGAGAPNASQALDALVLQATRGETKEIRVLAVNSLGKLGDPKALPTLIEIAAGEDYTLASAARASIERINRD
ncbi:MAG: HEAT repeat domain-containing protein [Planctomycetota bacterium]